MRSSKESGCFPYRSSTVCYIEVFPDGSVQQLSTKDEKLRALMNAENGKSKIYAVWPGKWRSDLFIIDDLDAFFDEQDLLGLGRTKRSYVEVSK